MLVLEIDEPTPSVNRLHGHHWGKKLRERKRWGWLVKAALLTSRKSWEQNQAALALGFHKGRTELRIHRYGARRLDTDNAMAGCKFLIDALKAEGLIHDDHPKWLDLAVHQHVGKPHRTLIELAPL